MQSWFSSGVCRAWALTELAWTEAGKQHSGPASLTAAVLTYNATTQVTSTGLRFREVGVVLGDLCMRPQLQPLSWGPPE